MKHKLFLSVALIGLLSACSSSDDRIIPSATGSIYECLVVMPQSDAIVSMVEDTLESPIIRLPQIESTLRTSKVAPRYFDDFLKSTRNILYVDIDSVRYTGTKAKIALDRWAHPQAYYHIQAPSMQAFIDYWTMYGGQVREWFVEQEIARQVSFYQGYENTTAAQKIAEKHDCHMCVPEDYQLIMDTTLELTMRGVKFECQLTWCCNNKGSLRRDLVVYSYPYYDAESLLSLDWLCERRDVVLGSVITTHLDGTYMGTEYGHQLPPVMRDVYPAGGKKDQFYAKEIRGLWRMHGGESMGGPYVSHTFLSPDHTQVTTAEVFLLAPGQNKRTPLRQAEAILYTRK